MYSGSTLTSFSGRIIGAHQKIDRIARTHLERLAPGCEFPKTKTILHFEGNNGPDAIKRKSPAKDEPWHYIQPYDITDDNLLHIIEDHYNLLVDALRRKDDVRAAFEAAWLAHAIVDGLTPAHHYPYEEKLVELRGGEGIETRTSIKKKLVMPGETRRNQINNNWKMWGPKGLFTTHAAFEWGFSTVILPLRLRSAMPAQSDMDTFTRTGVGPWFRTQAQQIAALGMYENFYLNGWSSKLARQVRRELAPAILRAVTTVWHGAVIDAQSTQSKAPSKRNTKIS
jgi:hypothetical protein